MFPGSQRGDWGGHSDLGYNTAGGGSIDFATPAEKEYPLDLIFRTTLHRSERDFQLALNYHSLDFTEKRLLMIALMTVRVRLSRYISLLRWYSQAPKYEKATKCNNSTIAYSNQTLSVLKQTSFYLSNNKLPKIQMPNPHTEEPVNSYQIENLPSYPFFNILIQCTPLSVQSIRIKGKLMTVTFENSSKFKIGVGSDNSYYLKKYSLLISNISRANAMLVTKIFQKIVSSGNDILRNLEQAMKTIQENTNLSAFILSISKITDRCIFEVAKNRVKMKLPESLAPYNVFIIKPTSSNISAISMAPLYEKNNSNPIGYIIPFLDPQSFLENIFEKAFFSKLFRIYHILKEEASNFMNYINVEIEKSNILIKIINAQVAVIYIDHNTFSIKFEYLKNIYINNSTALHAVLHGGTAANIFFKSLLFQYGLTQLFNVCFWYSLENFDFLQTPYIRFSSSSSTSMQLIWKGTKPILHIEAEKYNRISPIAYSAIKQVQNNINIKRNFFYGKFTFTLPDCGKSVLCFDKEGTSWHLSFSADNSLDMENYKVIVIYGRQISYNFPTKITEIVRILTRFFDVAKQIKSVPQTDVLVVSPIEIVVRYCPQYVPVFTLKIDGLTPIGESFEESFFENDSISMPKLIIQFHTFSKTAVYAQHLINNEELYHRFGAFMGSSLIPLHIFQSVFLEQPRMFDWSLSVLSDEHSFALVFKRYFSMNVMWKLTHYFQAIFPVSSISVVLQLALIDFPGFLPAKRLSHPTLRIHTSQLTEFRKTIEEFFSDRDALHHAHFKTKPNSQSNEFEHTVPSTWLHITATMQGGLNYEVEHANRTAKRIARALEKAPNDRMMMRYRLLFLAKLSTYSEQIGDAVAIAIDALSTLPGLDWTYLVKTIFPQNQNDPEVITFAAVKFQGGTFKLAMASHQGTAAFRVESQLPDCGVVTDAETLYDWLALFK